jgi:hypothetical protein
LYYTLLLLLYLSCLSKQFLIQTKSNCLFKSLRRNVLRLNVLSSSLPTTIPLKKQSNSWKSMVVIQLSEQKSGIKEEYRCNKVLLRGMACSSAFYIIYSCTDLSCSLYHTDSDHSCQEINENPDNRAHGIDQHTKTIIEQIVSDKILTSATQIQRRLEKMSETDPQIVIPSVLQINNYKHNNRPTKSNITFGELFDWLQKNSEVPDDDDKPFVIFHQVKVDRPSSKFNVQAIVARLSSHYHWYH